MCVYGLPQDIIITNKLLQRLLEPRGYYEVAHIPILWKQIRRITFTLIVDDFGIKYIGE